MGKKSQTKNGGAGKGTASGAAAGSSSGAAVKQSTDGVAATNSRKPTTVICSAETKLSKDLLASITTEIGAAMSLLESLSVSGAKVSSTQSSATEVSDALSQLENMYVQAAIRSRVARKQEEAVDVEIQSMTANHHESVSEYRQLQDTLLQAEAKADRLTTLSKTLHSRLTITESKITEDVKFEKEERLQLSCEFSTKIKDISTKLDELSVRRESVMTENMRLRSVLKSCLEELEEEEEEEGDEGEEKGEGGSGQSSNRNTSPEVLSMNSQDKSCPERQPQTAETEESIRMSIEEDMTRIEQLQQEEEGLRLRSTQFMEVFDHFQQRLADSNRQFLNKQQQVELLTKEVEAVDHANKDMTTHIKDCTLSTAVMMEDIARIRTERERMLKMADRQRALIERLQREIADVSVAPASTASTTST